MNKYEVVSSWEFDREKDKIVRSREIVESAEYIDMGEIVKNVISFGVCGGAAYLAWTHQEELESIGFLHIPLFYVVAAVVLLPVLIIIGYGLVVFAKEAVRAFKRDILGKDVER